MFSFVCDGNKCTNLIIGCACYLYFRDSNLMHDILLILSFCGKKHLYNEVFTMQSSRQCVIYAFWFQDINISKIDYMGFIHLKHSHKHVKSVLFVLQKIR